MDKKKSLAPGAKASTLQARRTYAPPTLRQYGVVSKMTQGSQGTVGDAGSQNMPKSDRRTKHNLTRVGTHPAGYGLYLFNYKPEHSDVSVRQFGVIAQEVENFVPEAVVIGSDGIRRVNYALLGIERSELVH